MSCSIRVSVIETGRRRVSILDYGFSTKMVSYMNKVSTLTFISPGWAFLCSLTKYPIALTILKSCRIPKTRLMILRKYWMVSSLMFIAIRV